MKRFAALCVLFLVLLSVNGCANNSPDGLFEQQIALINEQADAIEKNASPLAVAAIHRKHEELLLKMVQLNISDAERKKLTDANKDALEKAMQRLTAATMKQAGVDPKSISPFDKDKAK